MPKISLTFFSLLSLIVHFTPISTKITGGKIGLLLNENTDLEPMTLQQRPDNINKPPTSKFQQDSRISPKEDEEMLGDQPMGDDGFKTISVAPLDDVTNPKNHGEDPKTISSTVDPAIRRRMDIDRDQRLREIQNLIPVMIGRSNATDTTDATNSTNIDISHLPPIEKIVSFTPKCNVPKAAKDSWKEENLLHFYFNVSYNTNATLASAIIKLHRLPRDQDNNNNNYNNSVEDEEKLLRVSIYWYSKLGKKQRTRKRLCDSKVVTDKQNSVELNVKPAVTSWLESQNLGFAVKVENQEEIVLKASNFFKGDDCKSSSSFIPTQSRPLTNDLLSNTSNELRQRLIENYFLGSGMLPKISICTVESITGAPLSEKAINCQLHKTLYNQIESDGHRKVQNLIGNAHHLRHQKHLEENPIKLENHFRKQHLDIRNLMENKTMYMSKDELDRLNREVTR